jgi:hypothetical protein
MKTLPPPYHLDLIDEKHATLSRPNTPTASLNLTWDGPRLIIESANGTVGSAALIRRILVALEYARGLSTPELEDAVMERERRERQAAA